MFSFTSSYATKLLVIFLLICSNIFMTFAWYGHLKYKSSPLFLTILVSWGIAFFEYCLQVPANRLGSNYFSAAELKTLQEIITLVVFGLFSIFYLNQNLNWNHFAGFICIILAAFFVFYK
ncbi:MAG: DMT family protein [Rickettsiaceae bacterium]|nr:DMT family protein [Rickettsiaceae bacterium]